MTADHYGKIVAPELFTPTHAVGRLAFPLLAWIVGSRLALTPDLAGRYLRSLLPWALVSQPFYVLAGREWWQGNILLTLALGVLAALAAQRLSSRRRLEGTLLLTAALAPAPWVEFGVPGVAMVLAIALLAARDNALAAWALGPLGVLVNLSLDAPLPSRLDLCALAASPVALASLRAARAFAALPRIPKHLFYAYYPAHLALLHLVDIHDRAGAAAG